MSIRNMVYRFLKYGCAKPFPRVIQSNNYLIDDFVSSRELLSGALQSGIFKCYDDSIFELSGGIDSSFIISYFKGVKTFCTGDHDSEDKKYSKIVSDEFNTRHEWKDQSDLLKMIDFRKAIIDICKNSRYPYAFRNDLAMYAFLNYIKDKTYRVVCGSGIEVQLLGYHTIYNNILQHAIGVGDYNVKKAIKFLKYKIKMEKDLVLLDYKKCLGIDKNKKYDLSQPIWWNSAFTDRDLFSLMGTKTPEKTFSSLFEIEDFILQWFGRLYSIERPMDIAKIFGVEYYTPYMDKEVINITRKIPVELKKALNYHKYIFYHIASQRLPECIIKRKKGGLDLNLDYFRSKKEIIETLVVDYLDDRSLKIYMYINYNMVKYIIKIFRNNFEATFQKIWLLLNLSIWLEENGNICD